MTAEVWNCESSDRVESYSGTCIHAGNSLAGVHGWSITKAAVSQSTAKKSGLH